MISRYFLIGFIALSVFGKARARPTQTDSYDVLLHSRSLAEQRTALAEILQNPLIYIPRIQRNLGEYPKLLRSDSIAANRAMYVAVLVRDPSFAPILARILADKEVLRECEYACPVVFALTIDACFAGWSIPPNLDTKLKTVSDLQAAIGRVPSISLQARPIQDVVQGPELERHRQELEGKTEEQLIRMAGPNTSSYDTRLFAAFKLETSVSTSKNIIDLYLLAMNDIPNDASGEYRDAIHESIYRAELASANSR